MTNINTAKNNLIEAGNRLATAQSGLFWMNSAGYVSNETRAQITAEYNAAVAEVQKCSKAFEDTLAAHRAAR